MADLRQLLTLKQHYYPEGGWGWVILTCSFLVHVLNHGFLTSAGLFYLEIMRKFGDDFAEPAGWFNQLSFTSKRKQSHLELLESVCGGNEQTSKNRQTLSILFCAKCCLSATIFTVRRKSIKCTNNAFCNGYNFLIVFPE